MTRRKVIDYEFEGEHYLMVIKENKNSNKVSKKIRVNCNGTSGVLLKAEIYRLKKRYEGQPLMKNQIIGEMDLTLEEINVSSLLEEKLLGFRKNYLGNID